MAEHLVEVKELSFEHTQGLHRQQVLGGVSVHLAAGEVVVLTGPSGSGKSTLLTIIGGLRRALDGSVEVLGTQLVKARERALIKLRRQIGFIFQQHNLAPALTVAQNIQMGLQHSGAHRGRDATERIRRAAEQVGLEEHIHKHPNQLSGGQQQRAGIARALVNEPKLVLADEPTASLDRKSGQAVLSLFEELAASGSAVVLVTHDKRVIEQADRILMLEEGQLVPAADRLMKDTSSSVRTLMQVDSKRLGRMMSLGNALARVALADGRVDETERAAMVDALNARQKFTGPEVELVVELALAQAKAWEASALDGGQRDDLAEALQAVASADDNVTPEELAVIEELLNYHGGESP
jgi:putative ABC transport system ATP-binding protein